MGKGQSILIAKHKYLIPSVSHVIEGGKGKQSTQSKMAPILLAQQQPEVVTQEVNNKPTRHSLAAAILRSNVDVTVTKDFSFSPFLKVVPGT
ncbi:hypothetical protein ACH5RR_012687 [Cinchona calisaya]|uniref:Uncharacterized protein n=1 Tax=Cinchona calisaya TaxID=153742 RepID=A0ABD3A8B7_9GENT